MVVQLGHDAPGISHIDHALAGDSVLCVQPAFAFQKSRCALRQLNMYTRIKNGAFLAGMICVSRAYRSSPRPCCALLSVSLLPCPALSSCFPLFLTAHLPSAWFQAPGSLKEALPWRMASPGRQAATPPPPPPPPPPGDLWASVVRHNPP